MLDPATGAPTWVAGPELAHQRGHVSLAALGGTLYAAGGYYSTGVALDTTAASLAWEPAPSFSSERISFGLAALDAALYAVGGQIDEKDMASSVLLPRFATCNATTPAQLPAPDPSGCTELNIYRMQGATWVANISNADAADLGGLSCFIETFAERWLPKFGAPGGALRGGRLRPRRAARGQRRLQGLHRGAAPQLQLLPWQPPASASSRRARPAAATTAAGTVCQARASAASAARVVPMARASATRASGR